MKRTSVNQIILGDMAHIITGATTSYYSKSPLENEPQALLITGNSIDDNGTLLWGQLVPVWQHKHNTTRFIAQPRDVLVLARGKIRATVIGDEANQDRLLASANFAIIRPKSASFDAEYVAELLNSSQSRARLGLVFGSHTPSLRATDLRRLQIPPLSPDQEHAIAELRHARKAAYKATMALAEQQLRAATSIIDQIMWGKQ